MEQIHNDIIDIFTRKNKNDTTLEKDMNLIIFLTKQLIKKIYFKEIIKEKKITEFLQEKIERIKTTTSINENHKMLLNEYQINLEKILEKNIFDFTDTTSIEEIIHNLTTQIEIFNKTHILRLNEIINNNYISEQNLLLALTLIYNPTEFDENYKKLKKYKDQQKTIDDLKKILDNMNQNSRIITTQIQKIADLMLQKENYQKPSIINIFSLIKYIKFNKKVDFKIKKEIEKFNKILVEEQQAKENKVLKEKYVYENSLIKNVLEEIKKICNHTIDGKSLIILKKQLQELYLTTMIYLKKTITNMEKENVSIQLKDKFIQHKIEELLHNKKNNYITYIRTFEIDNPKKYPKKQFFISILLILNIVINIDKYWQTIIEKISDKEYDILLFNTIYDDELNENKLKNKIEIQNKILCKMTNLTDKTKSTKLKA